MPHLCLLIRNIVAQFHADQDNDHEELMPRHR